MKAIAWIVIIALILVSVVYGLGRYLGPDDLRSCPTSPNNEGICKKADAIVAISGGDTKARTNEAIQLYKNGWADTLIFSGAAYDADSPSNALAMKQQAIEAGVSGSSIIIEEEARDTSENASKTFSVLPQDAERVILVTSAYHQRRASIEFTNAFSNVTVLNHPVATDKQWSNTWWATPRGWWLALSELIKVMAT